MKTISKEEIAEAANKYNNTSNSDGHYYAFKEGAEWAIQELQQAPQSEVMTLEECKNIVANDFHGCTFIQAKSFLPKDNLVDLLGNAAELYASPFKAKSEQLQAQLEATTTIRTDNSKVIANLQAELEQVKAALDKIENECLCGPASKQPKKVIKILGIARQALQSTKQ